MAGTIFWVQDALRGGARQAIIHVGNCPLRENRAMISDNDQWYGPFDTLADARKNSDDLSGIAMRAECRCVRKLLAQNLPSLALLNEPLFRKSEPPKEKASRRRATRKAEPAPIANAVSRRLVFGKLTCLALIAAAAILILPLAAFMFPAVSVVRAGSRPAASAPFILVNSSPFPLSNLRAECIVELQPAAVRLQIRHEKLADHLASQDRVGIPCFQYLGGSVPQTSGVTMNFIVRYSVMGLPHEKQTFSFIAARNTDGICRWLPRS